MADSFQISGKLILDGVDVTGAFNDLNAKLRQIPTGQVKALSADTKQAVEQTKNLNRVQVETGRVVNRTGKEFKQTASAIQDFGDKAGLALRRFTAFSIAAGGVFGSLRALRSGISDALKFNRELVRVAQVTGQTTESLAGLGKEITNLSIEFGTSSQELVGVAKTLSQAGLTARDTQKALRALAATTLAPTFTDIQKTTEGVIASLRQFNIEADEVEKSLGSINAVAGKFAVESDDLITGIRKAGSAFSSASQGIAEGNDALAQFIALFTSVRATTRESADTIGTGLRTIFTRIQRPETIQFLRDFGVELTDLSGKFIGPFRAIQEIGTELQKLSTRDTRFSTIIEEIGGFRQVSRVIPLLQQTTLQNEALNVALQGQGSLARDAATAQKDLSVQLEQTKQNFAALLRDIANTNTFQTFIKLSLDLANALIKLADSAKEVIPVVGLVLGLRGVGAIASALPAFGTRAVTGSARFQRGGYVGGVGDGDKIPAMLEPGEFVLNKRAVSQIGKDNLKNTNSAIPRFGNSLKLIEGGEIPKGIVYKGQEQDLANSINSVFGKETKILARDPKGSRTLLLKLPSGREIELSTEIIRDIGASDINNVLGLYQPTDKYDPSKGRIRDRITFNPPLILKASKEDNVEFGSLLEKTLRHEAIHLIEAYPGDILSEEKAKRLREIIKVPIGFDKNEELRIGNEQIAYFLENKEDIQKRLEEAKKTGKLDISRNGQVNLKRDVNNDDIELINSIVTGKIFQNKKTPPLGVLSTLNKEIDNNLNEINELIKQGDELFGPAPKRFNLGGSLVGGSGNGDKVPALLEPGEFVLNKMAVSKIGPRNLKELNETIPRFGKPKKLQRGGFAGFGGGVSRFIEGGQIPDELAGAIELKNELARIFNKIFGDLEIIAVEAGNRVRAKLPSGQELTLSTDPEDLKFRFGSDKAKSEVAARYGLLPDELDQKQVLGRFTKDKTGNTLGSIAFNPQGNAEFDLESILRHETAHLIDRNNLISPQARAELLDVADTLDPSQKQKGISQAERFANLFTFSDEKQERKIRNAVGRKPNLTYDLGSSTEGILSGKIFGNKVPEDVDPQFLNELQSSQRFDPKAAQREIDQALNPKPKPERTQSTSFPLPISGGGNLASFIKDDPAFRDILPEFAQQFQELGYTANQTADILEQVANKSKTTDQAFDKLSAIVQKETLSRDRLAQNTLKQQGQGARLTDFSQQFQDLGYTADQAASILSQVTSSSKNMDEAFDTLSNIVNQEASARNKFIQNTLKQQGQAQKLSALQGLPLGTGSSSFKLLDNDQFKAEIPDIINSLKGFGFSAEQVADIIENAANQSKGPGEALARLYKFSAVELEKFTKAVIAAQRAENQGQRILDDTVADELANFTPEGFPDVTEDEFRPNKRARKRARKGRPPIQEDDIAKLLDVNPTNNIPGFFDLARKNNLKNLNLDDYLEQFPGLKGKGAVQGSREDQRGKDVLKNLLAGRATAPKNIDRFNAKRLRDIFGKDVDSQIFTDFSNRSGDLVNENGSRVGRALPPELQDILLGRNPNQPGLFERDIFAGVKRFGDSFRRSRNPDASRNNRDFDFLSNQGRGKQSRTNFVRDKEGNLKRVLGRSGPGGPGGPRGPGLLGRIGGQLGGLGVAGGFIASTLLSQIDTTGSAGLSGLSGAASGAFIGQAAGPLGIALGAIVGGLSSAFSELDRQAQEKIDNFRDESAKAVGELFSNLDLPNRDFKLNQELGNFLSNNKGIESIQETQRRRFTSLAGLSSFVGLGFGARENAEVANARGTGSFLGSRLFAAGGFGLSSVIAEDTRRENQVRKEEAKNNALQNQEVAAQAREEISRRIAEGGSVKNIGENLLIASQSDRVDLAQANDSIKLFEAKKVFAAQEKQQRALDRLTSEYESALGTLAKFNSNLESVSAGLEQSRERFSNRTRNAIEGGVDFSNLLAAGVDSRELDISRAFRELVKFAPNEFGVRRGENLFGGVLSEGRNTTFEGVFDKLFADFRQAQKLQGLPDSLDRIVATTELGKSDTANVGDVIRRFSQGISDQNLRKVFQSRSKDFDKFNLGQLEDRNPELVAELEKLQGVLDPSVQGLQQFLESINAAAEALDKELKFRNNLIKQDQQARSNVITTAQDQASLVNSLFGNNVSLRDSAFVKEQVANLTGRSTDDPRRLLADFRSIENQRKLALQNPTLTQRERVKIENDTQLALDGVKSALELLSGKIVNLANIQDRLAKIQSDRERGSSILRERFGENFQDTFKRIREQQAFQIFQSGGGLQGLARAGLTRQDVLAGFERATREEFDPDKRDNIEQIFNRRILQLQDPEFFPSIFDQVNKDGAGRFTLGQFANAVKKITGEDFNPELLNRVATAERGKFARLRSATFNETSFRRFAEKNNIEIPDLLERGIGFNVKDPRLENFQAALNKPGQDPREIQARRELNEALEKQLTAAQALQQLTSDIVTDFNDKVLTNLKQNAEELRLAAQNLNKEITVKFADINVNVNIGEAGSLSDTVKNQIYAEVQNRINGAFENLRNGLPQPKPGRPAGAPGGRGGGAPN